MKAVRFSSFGHPLKVAEVVEEPDAALESGQARLEVLASPINPSDLLTLSGQYGSLPKLPAVPGNEGVGRVVEVKDTTAARVGDIVFLPLGTGTWRSHLVVPAEGLVPVPPGTDLKQAAMMFINPPTADIMLREFVTLQPGDWVLQNAANSGVGRYLISLAKLAGYKTLNVVRREELAAELTALGADVVLTDTDDLKERVRAATGGAKVRLAIDAVGGDSTRRLGDALATGGTVVNYGVMSGKGPKLSAEASIFKDITLRGFWLVLWMKRTPREKQAETFGRLAKLVAQGTLRTAVEGTFSLDEAREALARAMEGGRSGKVLFTPNGPV
ncbi:zinc-dependent alcohol dehydrogenase family protein [Myxococcus sp. K15C18031901]|uniref:zinc-dependent alcohol dehydrogenase family protein n=1 Tax=Myxococcus dinghuensis TaxID=2906761 RepID=UPI0020A71FAF|nr:zinc-dependent alcohol dehydrogenase family protein [Myxococcus dinghuensis]MCP3102067.1 zinc-dependent alcohol dehydrogenase family protein [Myxococcus dinghuensis]